MKNIRGDEGIDFSDVEHARDVPERKHLRSGDLISPFIGEAIRQINFAIFHETKGQYTVDGNTGVIRPHAAKVSAEYLQNWFQSSFGRLQILRLIGGGGVPFLGAHNVAKLVVAAPPLRTQRELVAAMDAARAERRVKLAEADALLAGLDGFLLATLGLTPPPKDDRKVFAARRADVPARFDPHFHLPALAQNTRMLMASDAEPLGSLVSFSDEIWKPAKHEKPTFRYIEISNVNPNTGEARAEETSVAEAPSRARMAVRTNDIIVSLTRPHHGSIAQITPVLNDC
ncbi:MAG: hypothetical protein M0Q93_04995, partial [Terrimicrobiaceae bacterium]|nr:hypothetical protein [Terrimicrobiaceae bacterium]